MLPIHHKSHEAGPSSILFFDLPATQSCILDQKSIDYHPVTSLTDNSSEIYFQINPTDDLLDLGTARLHVEGQIVSDKKNTSPTAPPPKVTFKNLALCSIFEKMEVNLNNSTISNVMHYPLISWFRTITESSSIERKNQLQVAGYYDTPNDTSEDPEKDPLKTLMTTKTVGTNISLSGAIQVSLFRSTRHLVPGVSVGLRLTLAKPAQYLYNFDNDGANIKFVIQRAYLTVNHLALSDRYRIPMEKRALSENFLYPVNEVIFLSNWIFLQSRKNRFHINLKNSRWRLLSVTSLKTLEVQRWKTSLLPTKNFMLHLFALLHFLAISKRAPLDLKTPEC